MELNTELFKTNLDILAKLKKHSSVENIVLFYTKEGKLFAEVPSRSMISLRAIMGNGITDQGEFSIDITRLIAAMKGVKAETFQLEIRPNNINIISSDRVSIAIFGGQGSLAKLPSFTDTPQLGLGVISDQGIWNIVSSYIDCAHQLDSTYSYVHIHECVRVSDSKLLRKSLDAIEFPFPLLIDSVSHHIISEMLVENKGSVVLTFFSNRVEITSMTKTLIIMNNSAVISAYADNIVSTSTESTVPTFFSFKKEDVTDFFVRYNPLMKKGNYHCIFDIENNKLIFDNGEDTIERDVVFTKEGQFTTKKINMKRLLKCAELGPEVITCYSEVDPASFLYLKNDKESVVLTVVVD